MASWFRSKASKAGSKHTRASSSPCIERLEQRTLYSADFLSLPPQETSSEQDAAAVDLFRSIERHSSGPVELVFVDQRVADQETILEDLVSQQLNGRSLLVVSVDSSENGIERITQTLRQHTASAIHVISHGSDSGFLLGSEWFDASTIDQYKSSLASWTHLLADGADILLYGCNLSATASGEAFANTLSILTSADVASSSNSTGHQSLQADWVLENQTGEIGTPSIASEVLAANWKYRLLHGNNDNNILTGVDEVEFFGHGGDDILLGAENLFLQPNAFGVDINYGTFKWSGLGIESRLTEQNREPGYSIYGIEVTSGLVDFISEEDTSIQLPGDYDSRAAVFKNGGVTIEVPDVTPNKEYTLALYMGGLQAGDNTIRVSAGTDVTLYTVTIPAGVASYSEINWHAIAVPFTTVSGAGDNGQISIESTAGTPAIASARAIYHGATIDEDLYMDGGADADIILSGKGRDDIIIGPGRDFINGGDGDDDYFLSPDISGDFTLRDTGGTNDQIKLVSNGSSSAQHYYLPDIFSASLAGIEEIKDQNTAQILGESTHTRPLSWDFAALSKMDPYISIQGGVEDDTFGLAFSNTIYQGGDGNDSVRVYGNYADYTINRNDYPGSIAVDDDSHIKIRLDEPHAIADNISDTIEYIDFDDVRYIIETQSTTALPSTIINAGLVPQLNVPDNQTVPIDLSEFVFRARELSYQVDPGKTFELILSPQDGTLIYNDSPPVNVSTASSLTLGGPISGINNALSDTTLFNYVSSTTNSTTTETLILGIRDPDKLDNEIEFEVEIPVNVHYPTTLSAIESDSLNYTATDPASAVSQTITLSDPNNSTIESATIEITNAVAGQDILNFDSFSNITGNYNDITGVLSLQGADTLSNYETALRSITYRNTSATPDLTDREVQFSVNDGFFDSNVLSRNIEVSNIIPPALTAFTDNIDTTSFAAEVELTFAELQAQGDENDIDGSVLAFVVTSLDSGDLRIGENALNATPFDTLNNKIDATNNAYWTPPSTAEGVEVAINVVAEDDHGSRSATPVSASVYVNHRPTLSSFSQNIAAINSDAEAAISFNDLRTLGDEADTDGTVNGFVVSNVASDSNLRIGTDVISATEFSTSNNRIDAIHNAYWTPPAGAHGSVVAFSVAASDDMNDVSDAPIAASVYINERPVLTSVGNEITRIPANTEIEITFDELEARGDESDNDGSVAAFVVTSVPNGALRIGTDRVNATNFDAALNYTIDDNFNAYWTPDSGEYGNIEAFTIQAKDDSNELSQSPVPAFVTVNHPPTLSSFGSFAAATPVDKEVELSFSALTDAGDANDDDGLIVGFEVLSVETGSLRIGVDATSADLYDPIVNNRIDTGLTGYWTPESGATGIQHAFSVAAIDDDSDNSTLSTPVNVSVYDLPTLTRFEDAIDAGLESTEIELTFNEFMAQGDAGAAAGENVVALQVMSVDNGALRIGGDVLSASVYDSVSNNTINTNNHAYWTPPPDARGMLPALSVVAKDGIGGLSTPAVQASVLINDPPAFSAFSGVIDNTLTNQEVELKLSQLLDKGDQEDGGGNVSAFVVNAVNSGILRIGESSSSASDFDLSRNTVDANNNAYWTPPLNATGELPAFSVTAKDDLGAVSATQVMATVLVTEVPALDSFPSPLVEIPEVTEAELTYDMLSTLGNASSDSGSVIALDITALNAGSLRIGNDVISADNFDPASNFTIDSDNTAYWTPDTGTNGEVFAFSAVARDDYGNISDPPVDATIFVNNAPIFSVFDDAVDSTTEHTEVEITLAELIEQGDEDDGVGSVDAMVVQEKFSGSLRIGETSALAMPFNALNATIDSSNNAYWIPDANTNGYLDAFSVVAEDNLGAQSDTPVPASVFVNNKPTLTGFTSVISAGEEQTELILSFDDFITHGNQDDGIGSVTAFRVTTVESGTLRIGTDSDPVPALFDALTNNTIDPTQHAYWTPDVNTNGQLSAFSVVAQDNFGELSDIAVTATVFINNKPTISTFANSIDETDENTEVELTLDELKAQGDEEDGIGSVEAMIVESVSNGSLRIGANSTFAASYDAISHNRIDINNKAYWTPDGSANGDLPAITVRAMDHLNELSESTAEASVFVNDRPRLTYFSTPLAATEEHTETVLTLAELLAASDADDGIGRVESLIVKSAIDGSLRIGPDSASASPFFPGVNDRIDSTNNVYWLPDDGLNGTLAALSVVAEDNFGAQSDSAVTASVFVNNKPTLSHFINPIDSTGENTEVEITFAELVDKGDEDDGIGFVDAMLVSSVEQGTLRIGEDSDSATVFNAVTNNRIVSDNNAYWLPDEETNGTVSAITVTALDNLGTPSDGAITASVFVNNPPSLTAFSGPVSSTAESTEVKLTLSELITHSDADDGIGSINAMVVQSVDNGSLRIGKDSSSATEFNAITNATIDSTSHAFWLPDDNARGTIAALSLIATDNFGIHSENAATASVFVNNNPSLEEFVEAVASARESAEVELTFAQLSTAANAYGGSGELVALDVTALHGGTLRIGVDSELADYFSPSSNFSIDSVNNAYWIPESGTNGKLAAFSIAARNDQGNVSSPPVDAAVFVNNQPVLTDFSKSVDATNEHTEVEITLAELFAVGNEDDGIGSVEAIIVQSVNSGSLRIGIDSTSATAFDESINNTIDGSNHAYWTPDVETNGQLPAFSVVARDNFDALSESPVTAYVFVNDKPTLSGFDESLPVSVNKGQVELTFNHLIAASDTANRDGELAALHVETMSSGSLKIGSDSATAVDYDPIHNYVIDAHHSAYWTPDSEAAGLVPAFTVKVIDELQSSSAPAVTVPIKVNTPPHFSLLDDFVGETEEDTELELRFSDLLARSDASDDDEVTAMLVTQLNSGSLRIGTGSESAEPFDATGNFTIDAIRNAYWTPGENSYTADSLSWPAITLLAQDSYGELSRTPIAATVKVNPVNDAPQLLSAHITLDEGGTLQFNSEILQAIDVDNSADELLFTLNQLPEYGQLALKGETLTTGDGFTQSDINAGDLIYRHSGSESSSDSFTVALTDRQADSASITQVISLSVNEIIDVAPHVSDSRLTVVFAEAFDTALSDAQSLLDGFESGHTITLEIPPQFGMLELSADGNFRYEHNGMLIPNDSFTYRITNEDGIYALATVNITIEPPIATAYSESVGTETEAAQELPSVTSQTASHATAVMGTLQTKTLTAPEIAPENTVSEVPISDSTLTHYPLVIAPEQESHYAMLESFEVIQHNERRSQRVEIAGVIEVDDNDAPKSLSQLFDLNADEYRERKSGLKEKLDTNRSLVDENRISALEFATRSVAISSGLSLGYLIWLVRGGVLLSSVMTSLPAWRSLDALPILGEMGQEELEDDQETLESIVEDGEISEPPEKPKSFTG